MSLRTDFLGSWKELETTVKLYLDRNFEKDHGIDVNRLKNFYLEQTDRWTVRTLYEGQWLNKINDEAFKGQFLNCLKNINFSVSDRETRQPMEIYAGAAVLVVIWGLKIVLDKSTVAALIGSVIAVAASGYFYVTNSRTHTDEYNKKIRKEIVDQLERKGEELAVMCDKKDSAV